MCLINYDITLIIHRTLNYTTVLLLSLLRPANAPPSSFFQIWQLDAVSKSGSISVTNRESHVINRLLTLLHATRWKGVTRPLVTVGWFRKYWILNGTQNLNHKLQVLNKHAMAHDIKHRCVFALNENDSCHNQYNAFGFVGDRATPHFLGVRIIKNSLLIFG